MKLIYISHHSHLQKFATIVLLDFEDRVIHEFNLQKCLNYEKSKCLPIGGYTDHLKDYCDIENVKISSGVEFLRSREKGKW